MSFGQNEPPAAGPADTEGPRLLAQIGRQVLQALGEPVGLRGVQVKWLWENRYRANVVVGRDITNAAVAHSYFLVADGTGTIITATPALTRRYK
jgi:hypothetical protein